MQWNSVVFDPQLRKKNGLLLPKTHNKYKLKGTSERK